MSEFYDDYEDEFGNEFEEDLLADVEEQVDKKNRKARLNVDFLLGVAGISLALSSAFFPWYVFVNQEKFSIKEMAYGDDRILPGTWQGRAIVNVSPQAIPGRDMGIKNVPLPPDDITTASIPETPDEPSLKEDKNGPNLQGQPFPSKPTYRLLHVVNGRALIEDSSGIYMVQVGSVLPDNSKLAALEERDNGWALITSDGGVFEN
ncbi:flagellar protein [Lentilitoribacter sp. EG35]|uniref:flagellar protein n=1 Tax=Lentilitoribacter sp. EG35 TaxID=3234192 RepID=UPI0034602374